MPKKEPKKGKPKAKAEAQKTSSSSELSEDQLERVAGGASDIFAKIGDIKGESQDLKYKEPLELVATTPFKLPFKRF